MIKWIALGVIAALVLLFVFAPVVAWILIGLVVLLIAFVLLLPIGADVAYMDGQFRLALRADGFTLQLFPRKKRAEKPSEEKAKPKKEEPEKPRTEKEKKPKKSLNFTKEEILEIVKKALKGLGKFGKLTVRKFMLHYAAGGADPYNTAMIFSFVNAALSTLAPICNRTFRVTGEVDVRTNVDFTSDRMRVETELSITLRLIQVVRAALAAGIGVLGVLLRRKKRLKKEAKLAEQSGGPAPETEEQTSTIEQENNQSEERNDNHGDNNG